MSAGLRLSVLDLAPVGAGYGAAQTLRQSVALAVRAEALGYTRYWLSEHHCVPYLASPAPEVLITLIASRTSAIRVGAGGVMLTNHNPLVIAERFRALEALFPGRIDLGVGRAAGTDDRVAVGYLSRGPQRSDAAFDAALEELSHFLRGTFPADHPLGRVVVMPVGTASPPLWVLGSSPRSAATASRLGAGFAHAHHLKPASCAESLAAWRRGVPAGAPAPGALVSAAVICADSDAQAARLARTHVVGWLKAARDELSHFPTVEEAEAYAYRGEELARAEAMREGLIAGSPATVRERLLRLAEEAGVGEVLVTTTLHDPDARLHSYGLLASAFRLGAR